MKFVAVLLVVITVLIIAVVGFGGGDNPETQRQSETTASQESSLSPVQTAIARQGEPGVVIMDVRTTEEWQQGHAIGALHFSLEEKMQNGQLPDLEKDSEIYVYCRTGNRSGQAIAILREAGFTNLTNIGGLIDWQASDGPVAIE